MFAIFLFAMAIQSPKFSISSEIKMAVFVGWAAYGVVPTFHWTVINGGFANPIVVVSIFTDAGQLLGKRIHKFHIIFFWCYNKVDPMGNKVETIAIQYMRKTSSSTSLPESR